MNVLDYNKLEVQENQLREFFSHAAPYPHFVLDDFLSKEAAEAVLASFPGAEKKEWTHYTHVNERKMAQTTFDVLPKAVQEVISELNSERFIRFLEGVSGIKGLVPDPSLQGGGLHQTMRGGFLNVHADFTSHPHEKTWARRLNVLVYFNPGWQEAWHGDLQLWDHDMKNCVKKVLPIFNRCVVFRTDLESYHGVPEKLDCPEGTTRKSLALYYFTKEDKPISRSTEYKATPNDSMTRRVLIYLDKMVLRGFFTLKKRLGLSDRVAHWFLKHF